MIALALASLLAIGPTQDAFALASELLGDGSARFDAKDAAALADMYREDAEITLITKGDLGIEERSYTGKESIRSLYADLFRNVGMIQSKNVVEYARLLGPDLLLISGTFEPAIADAVILQFVQIRIREQDGDWRIHRLTLIPIPQS